MKKSVAIILSLSFSIICFSQQVKVLTKGNKISLRGLSVVSDKVVWASGSSGTVAKSVDSGNTWKWFTVKGFEKNDFRDIEAFDENTAIIMAIDSPAYILKTIDGGITWKTVFENHTKGVFLDAMDFRNDKNGVVIGDPINGKFFIVKTNNVGNTWQIDTANVPFAASGEACFASSGTNLILQKNNKEIFITGGLKSRMIENNIFDFKINTLPIIQGKESTGANSIAINNKKRIIVVGGDFTKPNDTIANCFVSNNKGKTWVAPKKSPTGYRSCIEYLYKKTWITCGLNGVDISTDYGVSFTQISNESFHVCRKSKKGNSVFFAGNNAKIGKFKK